MNNRIEIGYGLALNFTNKSGETVPSDVWIQFHGADGKSAAISIASQAERMGGVISGGLRSWAIDRINEYMALKIVAKEKHENELANGQFGVGA